MGGRGAPQALLGLCRARAPGHRQAAPVTSPGLGRCQRLLARRSLLWCLGLIWTRLPPANQERRSEMPLLVYGQYAGSQLRLGRLGLLRRGAGEGGWGLCPPPTQQRPTPWATAQEEVEPGLGGRGSMASRQRVACLWGQLPGKRPTSALAAASLVPAIRRLTHRPASCFWVTQSPGSPLPLRLQPTARLGRTSPMQTLSHREPHAVQGWQGPCPGLSCEQGSPRPTRGCV